MNRLKCIISDQMENELWERYNGTFLNMDFMNFMEVKYNLSLQEITFS